MDASTPIATRARTRTGLTLLTMLTLVSVACTPGGETSQVSVPPPPANTGVPDTEPITLTVWDQESGQVSKVWDQLNAEFQQRYPNVTIKRVNRDFGELKTLLRLAIQGPHPPDIVEANQGWPDMGQLVKAGLLLPLDNYAEAYGWNERVPENVLAVSSWTPDGKQFGTGNLFGYTAMGEIVGVYYNEAKLADLGLDVPTTFAGFEQAVAVAKQADEVPIQFGNNDAFPGIHEYSIDPERDGERAGHHRLRVRAPGRRPLVRHAREPAGGHDAPDWAEKGYFTPGFGGGGYDAAVADFAKGEGVFMITGNWIVANLGCRQPRLRLLPDAADDGRRSAGSTGGAGFPLSISAGSQHPDAAAAYIDWMTSDHASDLLIEVGQIPLHIGRHELVDRSPVPCSPTW